MRAKLSDSTVFAALLLVSVSGCSFQPSPDDFTQSQVDGVARKCGVARNKVKFKRGWVVISEPDERNRSSYCLYREFKRLGKSHLSVVGSRLYENGN
jgi:hypothetical protein